MTERPPSRPLLALETGTPVASVALLAPDGAVLAAARTDARNHGPTLLATVDRVLAEAGRTAADLGAVACGRGPGSFTGLRIGLATAKGICFALGLPLLLPSSLDAMALQAADAAARSPAPPWLDALGAGPGASVTVVTCLDARRRELFVAAYRITVGDAAPPERILAPEALPAEAVAERVAGLAPGPAAVLVGNGVQLYRDTLAARLPAGAAVLPDPPLPETPDAVYVGRLGARMLAAGQVADLDGAEPAYLRPSDAELNWQRRFGRLPEETGPGVLATAASTPEAPKR